MSIKELLQAAGIMGKAGDKLTAQIGSKGYYGEVIVEAEEADTGKIDVEFGPDVSDRWRHGARFGVEYVLDHIAKRRVFPKGGRVRVLRIDGHEVDTNNVVIAYVTANALFKALGIEPSTHPRFDETAGNFTFPK